MTEDMFGGLHQRDEVKRTKQSGWSTKKNRDPNKVLAAQIAAALRHGCLHKNQKTYGIALDTADFVRHVPDCQRCADVASWETSLVSFSQAKLHSSATSGYIKLG